MFWAVLVVTGVVQTRFPPEPAGKSGRQGGTRGDVGCRRRRDEFGFGETRLASATIGKGAHWQWGFICTEIKMGGGSQTRSCCDRVEQPIGPRGPGPTPTTLRANFTTILSLSFTRSTL